MGWGALRGSGSRGGARWGGSTGELIMEEERKKGREEKGGGIRGWERGRCGGRGEGKNKELKGRKVGWKEKQRRSTVKNENGSEQKGEYRERGGRKRDRDIGWGEKGKSK